MEADIPHNHTIPGAGTSGAILGIGSTGLFRY